MVPGKKHVIGRGEMSYYHDTITCTAVVLSYNTRYRYVPLCGQDDAIDTIVCVLSDTPAGMNLPLQACIVRKADLICPGLLSVLCHTRRTPPLCYTCTYCTTVVLNCKTNTMYYRRPQSFRHSSVVAILTAYHKKYRLYHRYSSIAGGPI